LDAVKKEHSFCPSMSAFSRMLADEKIKSNDKFLEESGEEKPSKAAKQQKRVSHLSKPKRVSEKFIPEQVSVGEVHTQAWVSKPDRQKPVPFTPPQDHDRDEHCTFKPQVNERPTYLDRDKVGACLRSMKGFIEEVGVPPELEEDGSETCTLETLNDVFTDYGLELDPVALEGAFSRLDIEGTGELALNSLLDALIEAVAVEEAAAPAPVVRRSTVSRLSVKARSDADPSNSPRDYGPGQHLTRPAQISKSPWDFADARAGPGRQSAKLSSTIAQPRTCTGRIRKDGDFSPGNDPVFSSLHQMLHAVELRSCLVVADHPPEDKGAQTLGDVLRKSGYASRHKARN
jgi:hypothetical protein